MLLRALLMMVLVVSPVFAESSAAPASASPTTQPAKFPSPSELVARMKELARESQKRHQVAYIALNDPIVEKPADFSFFGGDGAPTLRSVLNRLREARDDASVRAVLITLGADLSLGLAQAQEIRDSLAELRRAGKPTFVYADGYDTVTYTIASGATNIMLLEGGEIMMPGIGFETMYYKGALDKLGVHADYVQIGEYKGAEEPYTRTGASDQLKDELTRLADALFEQVVNGISANRNVTSDQVRTLIDETMMSGRAALSRGFVDHLCDQDGIRAVLADELGGEIELQHGYGLKKRKPIDFSNPFSLLATLMSNKETQSDGPAVALIYADGVIVDGEGEAGLLDSGGVGSEAMRRAFREALRDEKIKAVVLRIDSPGGSALASEVMWQAARRLGSEKPLVVSIGGMAASGGYYLASAGNHLMADPSAIIGSIGVVGGKFVLKDLYSKLGLSTESYSKGRNAGLFSSTEPWNERQRRLVTTWMRQTYDQFTDRIRQTRGHLIPDIDRVARGRIFLAHQALELGMIDEIGGLEKAISTAAARAGLGQGSYDVRVIPAPKSLADLLSGSDDGFEQARMPLRSAGADVIPLLGLSGEQRKLIGRQLRMVEILSRRPVMLMSPHVLTVR
jgi:protease-4